MGLLHDELRKKLAIIIEKTLAKENLEKSPSLEEIYNSLTKAPSLEMGHVAYPCFALSKILRMAPVKISEKLALDISSELKQNGNQHIDKVIAQGPYVNFFYRFQNLGELVLEKILNESYFEQKISQKNEKTMVEYSQPNTHKELHVGHMRNLCLGNALIKIGRYAGDEVISATYPGDTGTHVAKCLWFLKNQFDGEIPTERKGAWLGSIYTQAHNLLEAQRGTEKEEKNKEALTEILKQIEKKDGEYFDLWKETREWSINLMKDVYKWAKVEFDHWYFESEVDSPSVNLVKKYYEEGKLTLDQGAIGMDLSDDKLGFCLLLKSDGNGLYATKDVELARRKFEDYKIEKNIYVVDKRQAFHFSQVFKTLEKLGFENATKCFHLQYDFVELPDGAMSSRKGNIIPIQELIDKMQDLIKTDYLSRYKDEWPQDEIEETSRKIAGGAIKYGMLRMDNNRKIVFDMKEWLKLDGESGPYIQYVYARINSMLNKLGPVNMDLIKWSILDHPKEIELVISLTDFHNVVETSNEQYKPHHLCSYLYSLSKSYNAFYAECSVAHAESEELKNTRLALSQATCLVLKHGLDLLGIEVAQRM